MFRQFRFVAAIAIFVNGGSWIIAHPGHAQGGRMPTSSDHVRTWTTSDGGLRIVGAFVAEKQGQVQIRRPDDTLATIALADLMDSDREWVEHRVAEIHRVNDAIRWWSGRGTVTVQDDLTSEELDEFPEMNSFHADPLSLLLAQLDPDKRVNDKLQVSEIAKSFESFVNSKAIRTRWDDRFFYVESNAWQQQVPLPQSYTGDNAWRIPLNPVPAKNPISAKNHFLRGAIALAANGIPIFNPLNNRGDDAFLFGELDEFGGHCGRADDYHYHIAPVHLQQTIGKGLPVAYALDGYPIYGYEEADGAPVKGLDAFNGHTDAKGRYHYHATKTYPYLNGGFHGEVIERGGQVDPQPRAEPIRPDGRPLRDAKITNFVETKPGSYVLTYDVRGKQGSISYVVAEDGSAKFTFLEPNGATKTETYTRRRGPGGNDRRPPPPRPDGPPPRGEPRPPREDQRSEETANRETSRKPRSLVPTFVVTSPALDAQGKIATEYTCDGASASPAVEWKDFPAETKSFALSLWHTAPDQEKSYWVLFNIPADVSKVGKNAKGVGVTGLNDKRKAGYDPMCSKGPGVKLYHITVYALSAELKLSADQATRANLLKAIKDITLAEGTLDFQYERKK